MEREPEQFALPKPAMTPEDIEYKSKTDVLKEYLRRKIIHATIFNTNKHQLDGGSMDTNAFETGAKMNTTSGRSKDEKNPLMSQEVTCDFKGAPIMIQHITAFKKPLLALPRVDLPEEPSQVLRDPEEIALALGHA